MHKLLLAGSLSILMATVAFSYNITHPDLKNAHDLAEQAIKQVQGAQKTENTGGVAFGGHAGKAVELLQQAERELVQADEYNDSHQKKAK